MILRIDAQLSPQLGPWLTKTFSLRVQSVSSLGLRDATDLEIFQSARQAGATIMSKDQDFVDFGDGAWSPTTNHLGHVREHVKRLSLHPSPTDVPNANDASAIR